MQFMFKGIIQKGIEKFGNLFLVLLLMIVGISVVRSISNYREASRQIKSEEKKLDSIAKENQNLREELEKVHSVGFIEKQLRDTLGLAKDGEIVLILPDEEVVKKFAPEYDEEEETLPDPNWKQWLNLFI